MKKLAFIFSAVALLSFASCNKCYNCELTDLGITQTGEVCDEDQKIDLEAAGYTCTEQ